MSSRYWSHQARQRSQSNYETPEERRLSSLIKIKSGLERFYNKYPLYYKGGIRGENGNNKRQSLGDRLEK